jgi:hypothetical protein
MKKTKHFLAMSVVALVSHASAQNWITDGLVAYYPFNGNAIDQSGQGNNGVVFGAVLTNDMKGNSDSAYNFTGIGSSYISVSNSPSLNISNTITLTLWVRTAGGGYAQPRILSKGPPCYELLFSDTSSAPSLGFTVQNLASIFTAPIQLNQNEWIFVAGTYDGQSMRIYTNGIIAGQTNVSGSIATNNEALAIGENLDDSSDFFDGAIDNIRIYNRALSSSEVQQIYALESSPTIGLRKALRPVFSNLVLGSNYQIQVSTDLLAWTNYGSAFLATNSIMDSPDYFEVDTWNQLFFRLQSVP